MLPRIADIAPRTAVIDLDYLGQEEAIAACLLETDAGLVLIDPGPATTLPALRAALAARGASVADVATILLTHIHLDHAGATGSLLRENPAIAVHVHERGAPHLVDPTKLLDSASRIYGDRMQTLWGDFLPVPAAAVHTLAGGETLALGGRRIDVAYTPGHAWHHVSYLDRASGSAFVGDTAGERYPSGTPAIPATPPPDIELERWAESTNQFRRWSPDRLVVTHFGAIAEVALHLDEHEQALAEWSRRVRDSLGALGTDDEHADAFTAQIVDELRQSVSPRALQRVKPASVRSGWFGLARYWRKRVSRP